MRSCFCTPTRSPGRSRATGHTCSSQLSRTSRPTTRTSRSISTTGAPRTNRHARPPWARTGRRPRQGQAPPAGAGLNVVAGASADGSRAFFDTRSALVPEDTDSTDDVYMRENGETTLVTQTTSATPSDIVLRQVDASGQHVFFQTYEQLVPEDTDTTRDVYEVVPGQASELV